MPVRATLEKIKNELPSIEVPSDPVAIEQLVASGLILSGLTLGRFVHRRFRLLAFGACGFLAVSALTGLSPLSYFMTNDEDEFDDEESRDSPWVDEISVEDVGIPPIASLGVPHRIPEEMLEHSKPKKRHHDEDDRPAPSPDGDLGLAD